MRKSLRRTILAVFILLDVMMVAGVTAIGLYFRSSVNAANKLADFLQINKFDNSLFDFPLKKYQCEGTTISSGPFAHHKLFCFILLRKQEVHLHIQAQALRLLEA